MTMAVGAHSFGKTGIQFLVVNRANPQHRVRQFRVDVVFSGDFVPVYVEGDNSRLLPGLALVNTVLALGQDHQSSDPELYVEALTERFLLACPAAHTIEVKLTVAEYLPITHGGKVDPHNFTTDGADRRIAVVRHVRDHSPVIQGGVRNMQLFMTTGSMFTGFLRDQYTTTLVYEDRPLGVVVDVTWEYSQRPVDYTDCWRRAQKALLAEFAAHVSKSSQHTFYRLGEAVLAACDELERVVVTGVHQARTLADMTPFGRKNRDQIYLVDDELATSIEVEVMRPSK